MIKFRLNIGDIVTYVLPYILVQATYMGNKIWRVTYMRRSEMNVYNHGYFIGNRLTIKKKVKKLAKYLSNV